VLTRDLQEGDGKKTLVDSDDEIGERAIQGVDFPTVLRVR
jgi:hypothetical protein